MINLQEMITRGQFIFRNSPNALRAFELVNGKRSVKDISKITRRTISNVSRDLTKAKNLGLIHIILGVDNKPKKKNGSIVYQKDPVAAEIPVKYFHGPVSISKEPGTVISIAQAGKKPGPLDPIPLPTENELFAIAKKKETQLYEFKSQGTDVTTLTKEIAAMLTTSQGGIIFYGIEDDGTFEGTDLSLQDLDQRLQNSVKDNIDPRPNIDLDAINVLGTLVLAIQVPPWNKRDVYQYRGITYIRKGTNAFKASADEVKRLHKGEYVR